MAEEKKTGKKLYEVSQEKINDIDAEISELKPIIGSNKSLTATYFCILIGGNLVIALWSNFDFQELKNVPSIIAACLTAITIGFAAFKPWKKYINAKSTKNSLVSIKKQYKNKHGAFDAIEDSIEASILCSKLVDNIMDTYQMSDTKDEEDNFKDTQNQLVGK